MHVDVKACVFYERMYFWKILNYSLSKYCYYGPKYFSSFFILSINLNHFIPTSLLLQIEDSSAPKKSSKTK